MYVCTYVGMYVCMYVCMYICMYVFLYVNLCVCLCHHVRMHVTRSMSINTYTRRVYAVFDIWYMLYTSLQIEGPRLQSHPLLFSRIDAVCLWGCPRNLSLDIIGHAVEKLQICTVFFCLCFASWCDAGLALGLRWGWRWWSWSSELYCRNCSGCMVNRHRQRRGACLRYMMNRHRQRRGRVLGICGTGVAK